MAALPKKKLTKFRRLNRTRSNIFTLSQALKCQNCHKPILSHNVCPYCGFYKNRQVIKIKEEATVKTVADSK